MMALAPVDPPPGSPPPSVVPPTAMQPVVQLGSPCPSDFWPWPVISALWSTFDTPDGAPAAGFGLGVKPRSDCVRVPDSKSNGEKLAYFDGKLSTNISLCSKT